MNLETRKSKRCGAVVSVEGLKSLSSQSYDFSSSHVYI